MSRLLLTLVVCSLTTAAWAQQPPARPGTQNTVYNAVPTQFQAVILPGTGDPATAAPVYTEITQISPTLNCNLDPAAMAPPPQPPVVNPVSIVFDDPFTSGRVCRVPFPTPALAAGQYQWAGVLVAPNCNPQGTLPVSPCPSARTVGSPPFSIANQTLPPAAPTGLRFTQPAQR